MTQRDDSSGAAVAEDAEGFLVDPAAEFERHGDVLDVFTLARATIELRALGLQ